MTVSSLTQRIGSRTVIGLLLSTVVLTSSPIRLLSDEALV
jgi:hypothetical protein